jgi:hypothetical protein
MHPNCKLVELYDSELGEGLLDPITTSNPLFIRCCFQFTQFGNSL